jgi:hypothetical protein
VAEAVQKGGHNRLIIDSVSNIGVSILCSQDSMTPSDLSSPTTPVHYVNGAAGSCSTSTRSTLLLWPNTPR